MNTPLLRVLSLALATAGLLAPGLAQSQTAVTRGVTTTRVAAPPPTPVSADISTVLATVGPSMRLVIGKSTLLRMPSAVTRISVGNSEIADVDLISPTELYLIGKEQGTTNLIVWRKNASTTAIDLVIEPDLDRIRSTVAKLFPEEKDVKISMAAGSILLKGMVSSASKSSMIYEVADAYSRELNKKLIMATPNISQGNSSNVLAGANQQNGANGPATAINFGGGSGGKESVITAVAGSRVINLLSISEAQQVMLEVTVAEISKKLLDKMGVNLLSSRTNNNWTYSLGGVFGGDGRGLLGAIKDMGHTTINIDAEKSDGLVKILAEPNLVAISGQEASFLAGGKIFIPVARENSATGGTTITLEEKEYGVGVKFTPTVLEGGRIHLKVAPEVSELSQTGTPFTTVAGVTSILPSFTTRRASTTVQLMDGQSLAIAGLIKNNARQALDAVPGLGEIPVLGSLFRSNEFQGDRSELMFVITPRLVKQLDPGYALPTDSYKPPNRGEFFFGNQMEGAGRADMPADRPAPKGAGNLEVK